MHTHWSNGKCTKSEEGSVSNYAIYILKTSPFYPTDLTAWYLFIFKANLQCSKIYGIDLKQKSSNNETSILGSVGADTLPVFVDWFIIFVPMWTLSHTVTHTYGNWQLELKQHLKIQSRTLQKKILLLVAGQWLCSYWPNVKFERNIQGRNRCVLFQKLSLTSLKNEKTLHGTSWVILKGKHIPKVTLKSFCCYKLVVTSKVVVTCLGLG